jgi:hypothetical protein
MTRKRGTAAAVALKSPHTPSAAAVILRCAAAQRPLVTHSSDGVAVSNAASSQCSAGQSARQYAAVATAASGAEAAAMRLESD